MRVLLFSNDLMPFGELPTSGGGLRCWQLMKGLQAHGIEVLASMPGFTYLAEKHRAQIPEEQRELLWRWETQDEILKRTKPDAVLFASNWDHYGLSKKPDVPLIIDLHGSRLIETSMWDCPVDTDRKVRIFGTADCLLCAGRRQRSYFYGWLLQAGRVPGNEHFIRYIPVSLDPVLPEHRYPDPNAQDSPIFVSGGGWFPWQNQAQTIFEICRQIDDRHRGTIEIFGTPHETQGLSAEERLIREVYAQVKARSEQSSRIRVNGYIGREQLIRLYQSASVAVEAMQYNLERELAFTTRTIEYLWCGLPVLYNDFGEVSEHIREYDAGWTVNPAKQESIEQAVNEIFERPELVIAKGRNAQRLVRDRFSWDQTILPLVDFLNHPTKAPAVEPVIGAVSARASFLAPSGVTVDVPVGADTGVLTQTFIVPAENIATVEVAVALRSANARSGISRVTLLLRGPSGRSISRRAYAGSELPVNGRISIGLPLLNRPAGGVRLTLELRCDYTSTAAAAEHPLVVRGFVDSEYPFVTMGSKRVVGKSLLGQELVVQSLSLSFTPGRGRLYRMKGIMERVLRMVRNGEWQRLVKAGMRRLPTVLHRVRRLAALG
ncbi:MAG: glycosyltransferase family 4 protein [Bdellovibrionales bacterium]|nr:glycosyltransferase family 4 protein [Bdellovibrionales bacterium]